MSSIPTAPALAAVTALAQVLRETGGGVIYATVRVGGKGRLVVMTAGDEVARVECGEIDGTWQVVEVDDA